MRKLVSQKLKVVDLFSVKCFIVALISTIEEININHVCRKCKKTLKGDRTYILLGSIFPDKYMIENLFYISLSLGLQIQLEYQIK